MAETEWISDSEWETIVKHVPIVSVDLVVYYNESVLLGMRENEPAKGEWFVPGGRVLKNETRREAVHRIAEQELGVEVEIIESLGAFEHIYDTADVDVSGGKHYLANGYVVQPESDEFEIDSQHREFRLFDSPPKNPHENIAAYFAVSETVAGWAGRTE